MIGNDNPIVNPVVNKNSPALPPFAVMAASRSDLMRLRDLLGLGEENKRNLFNGVLYYSNRMSLAGPVLGAPYAAMMLETLRAWGAKTFLFYGWCGSISADLKIGTVLVPTGAYIDEGTSRSYGAAFDDFARPIGETNEIAMAVLREKDIPFKTGGVWSTDAIFMETPSKVDYYREREAVAVEMEMSALFTVGRYRRTDVGAILVVSDDLSGYAWKPGFKYPEFKNACVSVCEAIRELAVRS